MTRDYRREFVGTATASAGRRGRKRDIRRPGRATALGPLTAVPSSSTGDERAPGRAYDLAELDESRGAELCCALCAGVIESGGPMTYYADSGGGFAFYHVSCALVPEALA
jgi:hypothetical protein